MEHPAIAHELIERQRHDLDVRQRLIIEGKLSRGYDPEMEEVHLDNARRLQAIIGQISLPSFMKRTLALMEEQQKTRTINAVNLAFLSDRIAMFENRPQSYGTQFVSDEQGRLVPYQLDSSIDQVNQRRQKLGLNTLDERLAELTAQANVEQEKQPTAAERQSEQASYSAWRRKVGWIVT